ncbi:MAG: lipopolysaccharide kinase InaA family protein [Phycisphaerae bacterium]|nr:lipopolysaccharide kinase InaA family protein [Phycisphaerae bacterium]
MGPPPKANDQALRPVPPGPAGGSGTAPSADPAELADPPQTRWQVVKQNPVRTVYFGRWGGRDVYLKHFHVRSGLRRLLRRLRGRDARREAKFSRYLNRHGVATPEVLASGRKGGVSWVATAAVAPAEPADRWHLRQSSLGRQGHKAIRQVTEALAEMVARMHAAGVVHGDLHCGNIVIHTADSAPRPVLMDLHRMRRCLWVSRRLRAANLAQLCYDRSPFTTRTQRLRFLRQYLAVSGAPGSLRGWRVLVDELTLVHARSQYAQRDRRILRRGRYFSPIRLAGGWCGHVVLATKTPPPGSTAGTMTFSLDEWQKVLARPEALFTGDMEQIKDSPSSQEIRRRLTVGGRGLDVYVKRARRKYLRRLFTDCYRRSRAVRAFKRGHVLLNRRMATALPLAALERRAGPVLLDSILITEAVPAMPVGQFLTTWLAPAGQAGVPLSPAQQHHLARQLLWRIGRLVQRLHDHGLAHRDLKAGNLLVRWLPGQDIQLILLDMDGFGQRQSRSARRRFKGLMRLNVSLLECPAVNQAGRLRLLMGYLRRPGCGRVDFKPYWRAIEAWSTRTLRERIDARRQLQKAARRPLP